MRRFLPISLFIRHYGGKVKFVLIIDSLVIAHGFELINVKEGKKEGEKIREKYGRKTLVKGGSIEG